MRKLSADNMKKQYLYTVYHPAALDAPRIKISFTSRPSAEKWLRSHKNDSQYIEWEVWRTQLGVSTDKYPAQYLGDADKFLKSSSKKPIKN